MRNKYCLIVSQATAPDLETVKRPARIAESWSHLIASSDYMIERTDDANNARNDAARFQ